jgi:hypothetical protein
VPQFAGVSSVVSHPSAGLALQSAKPVVQAAMVQAPLWQLSVACGSAHELSHAPQFASSVRMFTSHPSEATLLQLANPVLQLKRHVPEEQDEVA